MAGLAELTRGSGDRRARSRQLLELDSLVLGLFDCPPGDPLWREPNNIGSAALLAFPGTPVVIERAGIGAICADRNQVVVYSPGQQYRRELRDPRGDVCSFVALDAETLAGAFGDDGATIFRGGRCFVPAKAWLRYQVAVARFRAGKLAPVGLEEEVLAAVGEVFRVDVPSSGQVYSKSARRAESVRERLSSDLDCQLTVQDVATEFGISPFHLVRQFKHFTGQTMHAYRTQLRLRAAAQIALQPEELGEMRHGLADIAATTGFASHSHLTARFRQEFGATPSTVRARALA